MIVTLLVGKFSDIDVFRLISSHENEFPVIVSTWKDQVTEEHVQALEKAGFDLVLSDPETLNTNATKSNTFSINVQLKTIKAGLKYINEKYDYDIIIKSRTDIYPVNYNKMISYVQSLSFDDGKLLALYMVNIKLLYYLDLIIVGKKNNINKLYNIENSPLNVYPELYLIHHYAGYKPMEYTHDYYERHFRFISKTLKERHIDFVWERNKDNFDKMPMNFLSDYEERIDRENYCVNLIRDFCKAPYML